MKWTPSPNDGGGGSKRKIVRWLPVAILVAGVALVVGEWVRSADDAGRDAPARQKGSPTTSTVPRALGKFKTVDEGLDLGDANRDSYEVAFDRIRQLNESALTMWLQRVSRMPELSKDQFRDLDRPSVKNIMRTPKRYAGQAIVVDVYAVRVWKWMPPDDFTATRWWNIHAGPLWQVDCLNADAQYPGEEPIFVICTFDPTPILGKHKRIGDEGELLYPLQAQSGYQPKYRLAGVFYKLFETRDKDGRTRQFPVLLVWQMNRAGGRDKVTGPGGMLGTRHTLIIASVLVLAFAFIYLKKKASRAKRGGRSGPEYRPLRGEDLPGQPAAGPALPPDDEDEEDDQVDPQLKAASEQYRKEKELDDATDDNGPTR